MSIQTPLVIAHRGASAHMPENTLEAIRLAIEKFKVHMVEFDIHATKDGVPVIIHDAKVDRTTNGRGYVSDYTFKELEAFDAGYYFDPGATGLYPQRGKGIKIPSLEQILKLYPGQSFCVELKEKSAELTHAVVSLLDRHGASESAIVGSKHHLVSRIMRKHYPHVRRFCSMRNILKLLLDYRRHKRSPAKDPMAVASMPMRFMKIHFDTAGWIHFLHSKEMKVFFWAFMNTAMIPSLMKKGADGFVVDDPAIMNPVSGRMSGTDPTAG